MSGQTKEPLDPNCDPNQPKIVAFTQIKDAEGKNKDSIQRTPCTKSNMSSNGQEIYFKKELLHPSGSFKERGASYSLKKLPQERRTAGVIAASAGNHALAMAYHGNQLKIPVTVVMPTVAPQVKVGKCKQYGADVIIHGENINEARMHAMMLVQERGSTYINGYDHPHIIAGQGTMGIEMCEQVPDMDAVIIPIGGAGMIAGVAVAIKHLRPNVKIYGVESERCPSFSSALAAGEPTFTKAQPTLADGLAVPLVGVNAYATAAPLVDKVLVVKEEFIVLAILRLLEVEKTVVEGGGAAGLAAILAGLVPELKGKKVVIPLCGANIDTTVLSRVIDRGLAIDMRLCSVEVVLSDRPGGVADLTKLIAQSGASLKELSQERASLKDDVHSVKVNCLLETRNKEHTQEVLACLRSTYDRVNVNSSSSSSSFSGA